jgi:hypothetical protein
VRHSGIECAIIEQTPVAGSDQHFFPGFPPLQTTPLNVVRQNSTRRVDMAQIFTIASLP